MEQQGITFSREHEMDILYKGEQIGKRRFELKAVIQLEDLRLAQAINYLEAYGLEISLLINFGNKSLQFKRVM